MLSIYVVWLDNKVRFKAEVKDDSFVIPTWVLLTMLNIEVCQAF